MVQDFKGDCSVEGLLEFAAGGAQGVRVAERRKERSNDLLSDVPSECERESDRESESERERERVVFIGTQFSILYTYHRESV